MTGATHEGRRLDVALTERGAAPSRAQAAAAIREGRVTVDGRRVLRPSAPVVEGAVLEIDTDGRVSRAGRKLVAALDAFDVDPAGLRCLDVGASTGGFTQVLLERGAARVVALDVGHGQLAPALRADSRVVAVEHENARHLTAARLAELTGDPTLPQLVVVDLSFISLTMVLPAIVESAPGAAVICLIKPQFEVGRARIGGGVVRDVRDRAAAITGVLDAARAVGLRTAGLIASPTPGEHGNVEALALLLPGPHPAADPGEWPVLAVAAGAAQSGRQR